MGLNPVHLRNISHLRHPNRAWHREVNLFASARKSCSPGPLRYRDANGLNFGDGCIDVGDFTTQCGDLAPGLVANVSLGGGNDTITGGPGVDSLFGDGEFTSLSGYGNDTLKAQDGEADSLSCQFGADTAFADAIDVFDVIGECESRTIGSGTAPPTTTPPTTAPPTTLTVSVGPPTSRKLGPLASGKPLKFRMTFSGPCHLVAGVVVKKAEAKRLRLGTKETTIAADSAEVTSAGTFEGSLRVKKKYRAKLRAATRATVFIITAANAALKRTVPPSYFRIGRVLILKLDTH